MNENANTAYQNLWNVALAVLRKNLNTLYYLHTYIRKGKRSQTNDLSFHVKETKKTSKLDPTKVEEMINNR